MHGPQSITEGSQGSNTSKAEPRTNEWSSARSWSNTAYWLTSPPHTQIAFSYSPGPRSSTTDSGLGHSTSVKICFRDLPICQSDGNISQLSFPLLRQQWIVSSWKKKLTTTYILNNMFLFPSSGMQQRGLTRTCVVLRLPETSNISSLGLGKCSVTHCF